MRKRLRALALSSLLATAGCHSDGGWTYRSDFGGHASPQFVGSDDTILVYESRLAPSREQIRFLSAEGAIFFSDAVLTHRGRRMPYEFVLVDQWHVALPMGANEHIGLVPEDTSPSPIARAFLSWTEASGGVLQRASLIASTNPHADLSCAIGKDGSIAVWRTTGFQFQASTPIAISLTDSMPVDVFCLEAEGRSYAAVHLIDDRFEVPHRSWVRIFEAGASTPVAEFPLVFEDISYLLHGRPAGRALLLGIAGEMPMGQDELTWIATRISFSNGQWRIERARLTGEWPRGFRVMRASDILLLPEDGDDMISVPWAPGETAIPYVPQVFTTPPPGFPGPYAISPSGRLLLWTSRRDTIRVAPAPR